ncbi:MAG: hypothetical protein ABI716_03345 [Candidatus Saccharibacteria bacterium]
MERIAAPMKRYKKIDHVGSLVWLAVWVVIFAGFSSYALYMGYDQYQSNKILQSSGIIVDNAQSIKLMRVGSLLLVASLVYSGIVIHYELKQINEKS